MKFKNIIFLFELIFLSVFFEISAEAKNGKISVMCSLFPVYDFSREIAGDLADIKLLLRPGADPHEFEPSPIDVKAVNDSDIFIFTGSNMETWARKISRSLSGVIILDASYNIRLINDDPHVWLDLNLAQKMVSNILEVFCAADPENAKTYRRNAKNYLQKLSELDEKLMKMRKNRPVVFAGEFSFGYFMRRYGFNCISAYDGENEPSVKRVVEILKYIKENNMKYVFSDAFGVSKITVSIAEQSGTDILIINSMHNISFDGFKNGLTFLKIMNLNYHILKQAVK